MIDNLKSLNESFERMLKESEDEISADDYSFKKASYTDEGKTKQGYKVTRKNSDSSSTKHYISKNTDKNKENNTNYEYNYKDYDGKVKKGKDLPSWQNFIFNKPIKKSGELKKYAKILKNVYQDGGANKVTLLKQVKDNDPENPTRFSNFWSAAKIQGLLNIEDGEVSPGPKLKSYVKEYNLTKEQKKKKDKTDEDLSDF